MTLEALIAEAGTLGLRINNLFQRQDGAWQANVRRGDDFYDFATGPDAASALRSAIAKAPPVESPGVFA